MNDDFRVDDLTKDLIQYSVVNTPGFKPSETNEYELTDMQKEYLQGLMQGQKPKDLCAQLGLSRVQSYLWKKQSKLFAETLDLVEQMQADDLESSMWSEALSDEPSNPIVKMFLLKARKTNYRENAAPPTSNTVSVHVTVAGEEFKVVADATPDED